MDFHEQFLFTMWVTFFSLEMWICLIGYACTHPIEEWTYTHIGSFQIVIMEGR